MKLVAILSNLKQQENNLKQTIINIDQLEKSNMQKLASRYDKMSVDMSSSIMINMAENNQIADAGPLS